MGHISGCREFDRGGFAVYKSFCGIHCASAAFGHQAHVPVRPRVRYGIESQLPIAHLALQESQHRHPVGTRQPFRFRHSVAPAEVALGLDDLLTAVKYNPQVEREASRALDSGRLTMIVEAVNGAR